MSYYILKIFRGTKENQYWESFQLPFHEEANVISALMEIQKKPVTMNGIKTTPVVWEQGCLEEVCGSCSMLINGIPRQACTALIRDYTHNGSGLITLAPLTKFPLVRDLQVDRSALFEALKKVKAWVDGVKISDQESLGTKVLPEEQKELYPLSTCMTCGCCSESCPQVNSRAHFVGPAALSQARLFHKHPANRKLFEERLRSVLADDGVAACGNAQNCVRVCPKKIPLTESVAAWGRETTKGYFQK